MKTLACDNPSYILITKTGSLVNYKHNFINIDVKFLNDILENRIKKQAKRIMHHDQVGFIPEIQ